MKVDKENLWFAGIVAVVSGFVVLVVFFASKTVVSLGNEIEASYTATDKMLSDADAIFAICMREEGKDVFDCKLDCEVLMDGPYLAQVEACGQAAKNYYLGDKK